MSKARPSEGAAASLFAALGDQTRLSLLITLSDGSSRSIAKLTANARMSRQAVTKHLRVLEDAGLVRCHRAGRESRYGLRLDALMEAQAFLDSVAAQWDEALTRLKRHVEGEGAGA